MKLTVEERPDLEEAEVTIRCPAIDRRVRAIMATANAVDCRLLGTDGTGTFIVEPSEVLYAETVDGRTFLYGRDRVLESPAAPLRAGRGPRRHRDRAGLEISHRELRPRAGASPYLNARLELVLDNGESVIASRQYAPAIKQKIGL